jgi:AcrR family transcriptional regulator
MPRRCLMSSHRRERRDGCAIRRSTRPFLDTAIALFFERGLDGANIEQIAQRAGVARATLYRRWPDSEALIGFLEDQVVEGLVDPQRSRLMGRLLCAAQDRPRLMAIYREAFIEPWRRAIGRALEAARTARALRYSGDTELLLDLIMGTVAYRLAVRAGTPRPAEERAWAEAIFRQLGIVKTDESCA